MSYNRRLAWVVIPAVLWAFVGLGLAVGITSPPGEARRAGLRLEMPEGGLRLRGHVVSLTEADSKLSVVIAVPGPMTPPPPPELPDDVEIEFTVDRGEMHARPHIELGADSQLREFPGGRYAVVTKRQILLFGHGEFRMLPRPLDMAGERLYDWIERQHQRSGPPGMADGPRPRGRRLPPG